MAENSGNTAALPGPSRSKPGGQQARLRSAASSRWLLFAWLVFSRPSPTSRLEIPSLRGGPFETTFDRNLRERLCLVRSVLHSVHVSSSSNQLSSARLVIVASLSDLRVSL